MSKIYAYIYDNMVKEIIRSDGIFENILIEDRYTEDFVKNCVECDESVLEGMDYDWVTGEFSEHIEKNMEVEVEYEGENNSN